ncbi:hypothetical protein Dimus_032152 [Dionaea muscipula]
MEDDDENKPPTTATSTAIGNPFLLILLLALLSTAFFSVSTADDASVMFKLARSFSPAPPGWFGNNPCKWNGVSCDLSGHVTSLDLSNKGVSGLLPADISQLSNLKSLSFQGNRLSGAVPSLGNLSGLERVFFDDNGFSSLPSNFFVGLSNLQTLSIGDNPFDPWTIPDSLSELTSLQAFRAGNASIYGYIPDDVFSSLPSLQDLRLSYNNLTGPLPRSFAGSLIQNLWINNQESGLSGALYVLGEMSALAQAWVHDNAFTGPIPDLSKCTSLFDLQLRENQLTGVVPASLTNLPSLLNVSLQNNLFQGPLPVFRRGVLVSLGNTNSFCSTRPGPCDPQVAVLLEIAAALGYPKELAESWKGNNACDDWSHVTCDAQGRSVTVINFAKGGWSGTISPAFANLSSLTGLILSDNNLYGKIPDSLTSLTKLRHLDVSNNNLTGQVPGFSSSVALNTGGNPFLGTDVPTGSQPPPASPGSQDPSDQSPPSAGGGGESNRKPRSYSKWKRVFLVIGIIVVSLVVAVALAYLIYRLLFIKMQSKRFGAGGPDTYKGWKEKGHDHIAKMNQLRIGGNRAAGAGDEGSSTTAFTDSSAPNFSDGGGNVVYPIEVLREVTDNFSDENILGRGGFGVVYKGNLKGTRIAVKRMESSNEVGLAEFQAEIAVLSKVRHRHLVALLGYCVQGNERLLVYEYMPQGTLGRHLFQWRELGLSPLSWEQRLVIALDVARGVEYLHSLAQQSFIHRDLKPSNILLGDNMRAKVSDFGLVKSAPEGKHTLETRLAGTFGYLAPEYAATGRVSTKIDVFAFGVVLMELITGRKALDESLPEEEVHLVHRFRRVIMVSSKENLGKSLIDPCLEPDEEILSQSIRKVADLAGHCTARESFQRPDMGHAVTILQPLVEQWIIPSCHPEDSSYDDDYLFHVDLPRVVERWRAGQTSTTFTYSINSSSQAPNSSSATAPTTPSISLQ